MSLLSASGAPPVSRAPRTLAALACLGLAAASVFFFVRQRSERARPEAFVKRFGLDLRRPEEIGAMKFESESDLAAAIAVRAALSDIDAPVPSVPAVRAREEEIAAARDLVLDAATTRPGWAYHRFLLGRLGRRGICARAVRAGDPGHPGDAAPARGRRRPRSWTKSGPPSARRTSITGRSSPPRSGPKRSPCCVVRFRIPASCRPAFSPSPPPWVGTKPWAFSRRTPTCCALRPTPSRFRVI